jgi:hypothetical protein
MPCINSNLTKNHVPVTTSVQLHIQNFKNSMKTVSHSSYLLYHPQHPTDPTGQEWTSTCPMILVATGSIPALWGLILTLSGPPFDHSNQPAVPNLANPCKITKVQGVAIHITQPDLVRAKILDLTVRLMKSHLSLKHWSVTTINYQYIAITKHTATAITYTCVQDVTSCNFSVRLSAILNTL